MEPMPHQLMGYDRAITLFSPDGRLLQVEYAKKTVKQGSTAIGFCCKDGVLLVTDKRIVDKLVVADAVEKINQVDDHIIATSSGILSDARVLIDRAQLRAQQHRVTYDTPVDILSIVKDIADLSQMTTQSGGLRPFGVSLIIGGIDEDGPKLFLTDPTGIFFQYRAVVIGEGDTDVEEMLHKEYKDDLTIMECLPLAIKALSKFLDKGFDVDRIDAAYVRTDDVRMVRIEKSKIDKIHKDVKKK